MSYSRPVYQAIASKVDSMLNCQKTGNKEWFEKHGDAIDELVKKHFPSGSGFDNGTTFNNVKSTAEKLVFTTAFHHMDANGYYDGWTEHEVIVTPSLAYKFHIRVTGRDRREIKEYIHECFDTALEEITEE